MKSEWRVLYSPSITRKHLRPVPCHQFPTNPSTYTNPKPQFPPRPVFIYSRAASLALNWIRFSQPSLWNLEWVSSERSILSRAHPHALLVITQNLTQRLLLLSRLLNKRRDPFTQLRRVHHADIDPNPSKRRYDVGHVAEDRDPRPQLSSLPYG